MVLVFLKTERIVPQREQLVIERLGKYAKSLGVGSHLLNPFVDVLAYRCTLKEQTIDPLPQSCITKDNISLAIDGVLNMQVSDARAKNHGIHNCAYATSQLPQNTLRSEIGKIDLDRTLKEREVINLSEAEKIRQINEAEGRAQEIQLVAQATAQGLKDVAAALVERGGPEAVNLRVAEQWVKEFGKLAKTNNTMIGPAQLGDVATMVSTVMGTMGNIRADRSNDQNDT